MKKILLNLDDKLYKKLKLKAVHNDTNMTAMIIKAIKKELES